MRSASSRSKPARCSGDTVTSSVRAPEPSLASAPRFDQVLLERGARLAALAVEEQQALRCAGRIHARRIEERVQHRAPRAIAAQRLEPLAVLLQRHRRVRPRTRTRQLVDERSERASLSIPAHPHRVRAGAALATRAREQVLEHSASRRPMPARTRHHPSPPTRRPCTRAVLRPGLVQPLDAVAHRAGADQLGVPRRTREQRQLSLGLRARDAALGELGRGPRDR
jgi:hypothetical protein